MYVRMMYLSWPRFALCVMSTDLESPGPCLRAAIKERPTRLLSNMGPLFCTKEVQQSFPGPGEAGRCCLPIEFCHKESGLDDHSPHSLALHRFWSWGSDGSQMDPKGTTVSSDEEIDLADVISDDSSFYGDEETKARLEARAAAFDPAPYWESHEYQLPIVAARGAKADEQAKAQAEAKERLSASAVGSALQAKDLLGSQHQPTTASHRQTQSSNLQADESLDAFLRRLPPRTVHGEGLWIQIDCPSISAMESSQGDRDTYIARGQEILRKLALVLPPDTVGPWERRDTARTEILSAARSAGFTSGKWIIFVPLESTDDLWSLVATQTLAGQLGYSNRVATAEAESEGWKRRIEVFTTDFDDLDQVGEVLERLVRLIKSQGLIG